MKKIIIISLMVLLILPIFTTAAPEYFFKKNAQVDIKKSCYNNDNSPCGNTVMCNITIHYPDGINVINGGNMTFNPHFFNYTINATLHNVTGEYDARVECSGGDYGFTTFTYEVNLAGSEREDVIALGISITVVAIMFILAGTILFLRGRDD
jgi:hypothetical protein